MEKILISACLVGQAVRYDGRAKRCASELIEEWQRQGRLVPICPEVVGGLSVPRPAAELVGGDGADVLDDQARLVTAGGRDVTEAFIAGAHHALELARHHQVRLALLKARSPSCGSGQIYDGSFSGTLQPGQGVTAALLQREGVAVFSEEEIAELARYLEDLESC